MAKEIQDWLASKNRPEQYKDVKDLESTRNFLHTLDLLETALVRFEISTFIARQIFNQVAIPAAKDSLMYKFDQIDVEEYFASSFLEFCYQLDKACREICKK